MPHGRGLERLKAGGSGLPRQGMGKGVTRGRVMDCLEGRRHLLYLPVSIYTRHVINSHSD